MKALLFAFFVLVSTSVGNAQLKLGETYLLDQRDYGLKVTVVKMENRSDKLWNYYGLEIEVENKHSTLMTIDGSKVFMVDDTGIALFSERDELKLIELRIARLDRELDRVNILLGRTTLHELRQSRRALESLSRTTSTAPILEVPPGAKQKLTDHFHTPLEPKAILLSIVGVILAGQPLEVRPIRIILE